MCRRSGETGACDWVSEAWLDFAGGTMDAHVGEGWADCFHLEDLDAYRSAYLRGYGRQDMFTCEFRMRHRDGTYHWMRETARPFQRDGAFAGFFGVCTNVSELQEARDIQRHALADRKLLLREVHHRVKNNLQTLMALVRYIRRTAEPSAQICLDTLNLRLVAMALVQRYLHTADDMTQVSLRALVGAVLPLLSESGLAAAPHLLDTTEDVEMPAQAAAYAGLAVSESVILLTESKARRIEISILDGATRDMIIRSAGGAMPTHDLGLRLIRQYARGAGATLAVTETAGEIVLALRFSGSKGEAFA
jgi:PAS domain S-box-containing protein